MVSSEKKSENLNPIAVIRAKSLLEIKTTIHDFIKYGRITFADQIRLIKPEIADIILINVLKSPLRMCCEVAAAVPLKDDASSVIGKLRNMHSPAHIIIVSPRHEIYDRFANYVDELPETDLMPETGIVFRNS